MQCIILAAGRGTRMKGLTEGMPKHLLQVGGKTLLEHKLDILPSEIDEVILVVGYMGSMIQNYLGGLYGNKRLLYVEQEDSRGGSADALWSAKEVLHGKFLVMNGDNLYAGVDIRSCLSHEWAVLVKHLDKLDKAAKVVADKKGRITNIFEREEHDGGEGYANTGLYVLDLRIFDYKPVPKSPGSRELGLPQTMMQAARNISIQAVPATFWVEIKTPEDLEKAEHMLKNLAT